MLMRARRWWVWGMELFNVEIEARDMKCNWMLKTSDRSSTLCKIGTRGYQWGRKILWLWCCGVWMSRKGRRCCGWGRNLNRERSKSHGTGKTGSERTSKARKRRGETGLIRHYSFPQSHQKSCNLFCFFDSCTRSVQLLTVSHSRLMSVTSSVTNFNPLNKLLSYMIHVYIPTIHHTTLLSRSNHTNY